MTYENRTKTKQNKREIEKYCKIISYSQHYSNKMQLTVRSHNVIALINSKVFFSFIFFFLSFFLFFSFFFLFYFLLQKRHIFNYPSSSTSASLQLLYCFQSQKSTLSLGSFHFNFLFYIPKKFFFFLL